MYMQLKKKENIKNFAMLMTDKMHMKRVHCMKNKLSLTSCILCCLLIKNILIYVIYCSRHSTEHGEAKKKKCQMHQIFALIIDLGVHKTPK